MEKREVARILENIAVLLELKGENPFKTRAYSAAARSVETLSGDLNQIVANGEISSVKGIGRGLAEKINTLVTTGSLPYYDELRAEFPPTLFELFDVPGLGPKKIKVLYDEMDIVSLGELEYACNENRLVGLPGFGKKTQDKILKGIEMLKRHRGKFLYAAARPEAEAVRDALAGHKDVERCSLAGSFRRRKEVVKDIDMLVATENPAAVMDYFVSLPGVQNVVAHGETKSSITLESGINVDLRAVSEAQYPYALHHFTGSKEHNVAMRSRSLKMGLKMNEYGLFAGDENLPCRDEEEIFARLGLDYIPPELREDMGEIEAAEAHSLPELVSETDIKGQLHVHSSYSDGGVTLADMVGAIADLGYQYVGISDHSQSAYYAGGLKEEDIVRQHEEITKLNKKYKKFHIFKGIESDIRADGSLDYPDEILKSFDFVIASVHSKFNLPQEEMTARIVKALEHPATTILGHPTGRLLLSRDPYAVDIYKVIDAAAANGVVLEINAHPYRLDLDWRYIKYAKEKGARFAIDTDAHHIDGLEDIFYGVGVARKGWLGKKDVINCLSLAEIREFFAAKRG